MRQPSESEDIVRTVWIVVAGIVGLIALAGCSSPAATNTAVTSSVAVPTTSINAPARTHEITYMFHATGAAGDVDVPFAYVTNNGSTVTERTGGVLSMRQANLPVGTSAMVAVKPAPGMLYSSCSIEQDGRTVAELKSLDPTKPASCSYTVR